MRAAGVETRHALFQELGVLGPSVFLNAGPFLRVRRSSAELTNADLMVRGSILLGPRCWACATAPAACSLRCQLQLPTLLSARTCSRAYRVQYLWYNVAKQWQRFNASSHDAGAGRHACAAAAL